MVRETTLGELGVPDSERGKERGLGEPDERRVIGFHFRGLLEWVAGSASLPSSFPPLTSCGCHGSTWRNMLRERAAPLHH
jgi:hypothetical protein